MSTQANADIFLMEEYRTLRTEIDGLVKQIRNNERNCVVAIMIVYAWLATHVIRPEFKQLVWQLPIAVPIFGAIYYWSLHRHIKVIAKYLIEVEALMLDCSHLKGWEHFIAPSKSNTITNSMLCFWAALIVLSLVVGMVGDNVVPEQACVVSPAK